MAKYILVSGGENRKIPDYPSEAQFLKSIAVKEGVPSKAIKRFFLHIRNFSLNLLLTYRFCGIPAFVYNSEAESDSKFLLQLHTNWLPFYINVGGAPTMFVFINNKNDGGFILIEDM